MPTIPFRPYALKLKEYRELHALEYQRTHLERGGQWYFSQFAKRFEGLYSKKKIKAVFALAHKLLEAEGEGYNVDLCWAAFDDRKGFPKAILNVCKASQKAFADDRQGTGIVDYQIARLARLRHPGLKKLKIKQPSPAAEPSNDTEATPLPIEEPLAEEVPVPEAASAAVPEPPVPEPSPAPPPPVPDADFACRFQFRGNTVEFRGPDASRFASNLLNDYERTAGSSPIASSIPPPPVPPPPVPPPAQTTSDPPRKPAPSTDAKLQIRVLSVIGHEEVSIADVVERLKAIDALPSHRTPKHLHDHLGVELSRMARKGVLERVERGRYRRKPFLRVVGD